MDKNQRRCLQEFLLAIRISAFSVNPAQVDIVAQYIENQKVHHAKKTFQKEYLSILSKYKIEYDPQFIWD